MSTLNKIDGASRTIRELLDNRKYSIDYYQREYRWEQKHIEALIEDLETKFEKDYTKGDPRTKVRDYAHYFLGPIVVSRKGNRRYVIDGQQRLTSLTLLLVYLHHLQQGRHDKVDVTDLIFSEQFGEKSFNLEVEERQACMKALLDGEDYAPPEAHGSVANMLARYADIESVFPDDLEESALPYFVDWLLENVELVEIVTYNDEDAYQIFETMNDRGLRLTPSEMLKGYLLSKIGDEEQVVDANELWRHRMVQFEELGPDEHADFFKAWLRSQHARKIRERKRGASNEDFDHIGSGFHRWVRDHHKVLGLDGAADFREFIERDFERFSRWYLLVRKAENELVPGLEFVHYNARSNFTLQPSVLLAALSLDDDDETVRRKLALVAGYLDLFIFRRVVNFRTLGYSSIVYTMFVLMKDIRGLGVEKLGETLEKMAKELDDEAPHGGVLNFAVHERNRARVHMLLARLTHHVEAQSGLDTSIEKFISRSVPDPFQVEHVWADKPERHTAEFPDERDFRDYRNRLGGLLLVPASFNQSYGDETYEKKYPHYLSQNLLAKSLHEKGYEKNPKFLAYRDESGLSFEACPPPFAKADLDARQKLYAEICAEVWSLDRFSPEEAGAAGAAGAVG